jgi:hypothetical protein
VGSVFLPTVLSSVKYLILKGMKTILKAKLIKQPFSRESADFHAQIVDNRTFVIEDIIDELLKENTELDAKMIFNIVCAFNRKVIELVASGNQVNTGLVSLQPSIKGLLNNKNWNPAGNRLEVLISQGIELGKTLIDTTIILQDEQGVELEVVDQTKKLLEMKLTAKNDTNAENFSSKLNSEPPCGIAFRRWLCNS